MTSITRLALATTACLLSICGLFGDTVTSTSCSATVGTQTFSQTNPSSCMIYQNATNGKTLYYAAATAYAGESLFNEGPFEGSAIFEGYALVQTYTDYFGSAEAIAADASATTTATFSSAVPSTAGTITFTGDCVPGNLLVGSFGCDGTVTLIDSLGTTSFTAPICEHEGLSNVCASTTLPVELGSDFTVELSEDNAGFFNTPLNMNPSVLFTLANLNGTPVSVELAPVPEPSTLSSVGFLALAAGFFRLRRNKSC